MQLPFIHGELSENNLEEVHINSSLNFKAQAQPSMIRVFLFLVLFTSGVAVAQKKPLDHSVYDSWQSIGERAISNDGKWVAYAINVQEGDADLYVRSTTDANYLKHIPRGYNALFTEDSRFLILKIKPAYKETREARIKKKKPEEFPKDSFAIIELGKEEVWKTSKVKSYKAPQKASGWVAYHKEREVTAPRTAASHTQKTVDSLKKTLDSLVLLVTELKNKKGGNRDETDADDEPVAGAAMSEGSDLVLRNLNTNKERIFKNVVDFQFNTYGQKLLMRVSKSPRDTASKNAMVVYHLEKDKLDTILKGGNDFKSLALTEDGSRVAFLAERDTAKKVAQRFYQLYLYNDGEDSAQLLIDKHSSGMQVGITVSENGNVSFSKSGKRLFFGTAAIQPPKDTSLIDIDLVKLDIWHYKDDYLQTQQLFNLQNELKRNYLAVYDFGQQKMEQLGSKGLPTVIPTGEGDGKYFLAVTDTGRRVPAQWTANTLKDIYAIDVATGTRTLIKRNHSGQFYASSSGKYVVLYDQSQKHFLAWDGKNLKNITSKIKVPLYNEEHDTPNDPSPYGIVGWHQNDSFVYIYDRYDVWQVDPTGVLSPVNITKGRDQQRSFRYVRTDPEERFLQPGQTIYFRVQEKSSKKTGLYQGVLAKQPALKPVTPLGTNNFSLVGKSKSAPVLLYTKENFVASPELYAYSDAAGSVKLATTNPQQESYNWGTAELYKWKTFNGKDAEGILYKPEGFDPAKKYPMLIYFYERVTDGLFNYNAPGPTPSRLNIPFFVSRGYLVFTPDIAYTKGHPAKDAYNYIVSGAQALAKNKWVDAKNIGIQGQSWGGYQVMALITQTPMFKAAWAGAPVVNMTSAYGGIRWESGNNRQFQYEKGQSRIGVSLWDNPSLYIENSPLFHFPKVKTPVVIMANDADGAVPWYQGIETFTALRRLNKPVWMLNYNGEAHNLVERKNRKDIQIRQQQFFDWLLKGEKPAKWILEGVPAVKKGKDWGLDIID